MQSLSHRSHASAKAVTCVTVHLAGSINHQSVQDVVAKYVPIVAEQRQRHSGNATHALLVEYMVLFWWTCTCTKFAVQAARSRTTFSQVCEHWCFINIKGT